MTTNREWLKSQILRKYLDGLSQEQIAIDFDISEGTVSASLQESRQQDDNLMLKHEIAVLCNKYNIPIQELASNLAFSNALKRMAFEHNKMDLLLRTLNKIIVQDGSFSPEKIANKILQICNFMEATGLSLQETDKITEEKFKQLSEIKMKIIESKKIIARTEQAKTEALRKKRITLAKLRKFTAYKKAFEYAGVDFNNFKQISNILFTIQQLNSNPALIINEMKKTNSLENRKSCLEKDCDEIEQNLQIYKKMEQDRIKYKGSFSIAVDLVAKTLAEGVTEDEIISIFDTIIKNRFYLSISDFINAIDTYGETKSAIFQINRELEKLKSEKQDLFDSRPLGFI
jgi:uncharacterized protein (DUF433 family)